MPPRSPNGFHTESTNRRKLGIASSMRAASAVTGFSFRAIQAAKAGGCNAFLSNGRVDCDSVLEWFAENAAVLEAAGERVNRDFELALKARADRMLREHELAVAQGKYVLATDVEERGSKLGAAIRRVVQTIHLCAATVVGVSVAEAEARLREVENEILEQLHTIELPAAEGTV